MKNVIAKLAVGLSILFILAGFSETAHAAIAAAVPEVDSASMGAALALLVGGYLLAVSKFRRK